MLGMRQTAWKKAKQRSDVEVMLDMTSTTGLSVKFVVRFLPDQRDIGISWGDGAEEFHAYASGDYFVYHTFNSYGTYAVQFYDTKGIGFRYLDGQAQYLYDAAPISIIDYSGLVTEVPSGSFKKCTNLKKVVLPASDWIGQRPFAYCTSLKEVELGPCTIHYDGSFQECTALESFKCKSTGLCWSYVWKGCTLLKELKLGSVEQFATQDFYNTPNLMDIWISDKTVDQIKQTASSGNIKSGYGAKFPWSANSECRFHGTDGIVLGDGTVVQS